MRRALIRYACCIVTALHALVAFGNPLPRGPAHLTLDIEGMPIEVYTYKPQRYSGGPLLLTLHGLTPDAEGYREYSKPFADRFHLLVVAPLFDRERFPTWRYQAGGIARTSRQPDSGLLPVEPESSWTGRLFLKIVETIRVIEDKPDLPYYLIGHSAGGQALGRFAAFIPNAARRIVIANPGTYLWPAREARFPYGFGGLPDALSDDAAIRRYLAQPVTIFLGQGDVNRDTNLNVSAGAMRQGPNRHERGLNAFRAAQKLAHEKSWEFNWQLVEVPAVGHSAQRMYESLQSGAALLDQ
jgi:pimeloyl-ACP methyl ester carboxylesterase